MSLRTVPAGCRGVGVSGTSEPRRQRLEDRERTARALAVGGRTEEEALVTRKPKNRDDRALAGMSV